MSYPALTRRRRFASIGFVLMLVAALLSALIYCEGGAVASGGSAEMALMQSAASDMNDASETCPDAACTGMEQLQQKAVAPALTPDLPAPVLAVLFTSAFLLNTPKSRRNLLPPAPPRLRAFPPILEFRALRI